MMVYNPHLPKDALESRGKNKPVIIVLYNVLIIIYIYIIERMAEHMDYPGNIYKICLNKEDSESVQYLLCNCPALQGRRLQCLGKNNFHNLEYLSPPRFIKSSGLFR